MLLGTNVLERFNNTSITNGLFLYTGLASPLNQLPVLNFPPGYEDLIYAGVSLVTPIKLQLAVKAPGEREISWTSLSNFVNRLESTVVMPPVWRPMFSTNGNGGTVRYTDRTASAALRFYRVVIE